MKGDSSSGTVFLRPGREKPVLQRHPWVFSGAIGRVDGEPLDGDIVTIVDRQGRFLARGYYNRHSQISVRLLSWVEDESLSGDFWRERIRASIARRSDLLVDPHTTACRLIYAESDLLPGLIADRYGDVLVLQALTLGIDRRKQDVAALLAELTSPSGIYERSDADVRTLEHLDPSCGPLWGDVPPGEILIKEFGHRFSVDVHAGQKTGFYLDQRINRQLLTHYAQGREVLNAFAYSGGFAVYARSAGAASVVNVDTSEPALDLARRNLELNGYQHGEDEYIVGDVFNVLRTFRDAGRQFDLIVLDPPKFAYSRSQVDGACRGYKDINLLALKLLRPEGILFTMSCTGLVSADLFQKVVFGAALDAHRDVQILQRLSQAPDHPILLTFPEGEYLKGLVCRVV